MPIHKTEPVTLTQGGELRGRERDGALLFAGIPYAAPPVGRLRFRAPEPHPGWQGVRDARRFGPAAPQLPGTGLTAAPLAWEEDCLTLNVCTPALDEARRPVMVWIHGGGFRSGKGGIPWYDGRSFATRGDVVTVTINYRLGALGFAHLPDVGGAPCASSGLNGIRDQIFALAWVQANIAAFGGDPERVTIAGESAGAMCVGTLLGCPDARGLFRGAVAQSGAAHHVLEEATAREIGGTLARELHVEDLAGLQAAEVEDILNAQQRIEARMALRERDGSGGPGGMPFQPVVEGRILPRTPLEAVRAGAVQDVHLLVGTNRDESTLFGQPEVDEERLQRIAGRLFEDSEGAVAAYRRSRPQAAPPELATAFGTDQTFRIPAIRLLEAQSGAGGKAWQYLFTWRSRAFGGKLGACHALEIPFTWNTLTHPGVDTFLGPGELPYALADRIHGAWTAFFHEGDPATPELGQWPCFDAKHRAVMELGDRVGLLEDPDGETRVLWEGRR